MDGGREDEIRDRVIDAVRMVFDPEIPVNIYELGLIYRLDVAGSGDVEIDMTLTSPNCPEAESLPPKVKRVVESVEGVRSAHVKIVWEPTWTPDKMTDAAKLELGLM